MATLAELGPHHPAVRAAAHPDAVAARLTGPPPGAATADELSYAALADHSARLARALQARGLRPGDHLAVLCGNRLEMFVVCWAALRSGVYCTPISTWLTAREAAYIVEDAGARALIADSALGELPLAVAGRADTPVRLAIVPPGADDLPGFERWDGVLDAQSGLPLEEEPEGALMFYSSGTTGRPKGVRKPLSGRPAGSSNSLAPFVPVTGLGEDTVYLSPAPLYHAAPLGWSLGTMRLGGTVVVLPTFDAEATLAAVETHRVTHVQFVPTMMARILRLDPTVRDAYDRSSLRVVLHAAAPCPRHVKQEAIEWFGPIVHEYYSGTEGSGITYITSEEWLRHPGSVGRPLLGEVHVTDDDGEPVPAGTAGTIWFAGGDRYEYHRDRGSTDARRHRHGWTTLDDMGFVDAEGYVHLTDRRAHMIVSGGVNISPREIEDVLTSHPLVDDAAAFGVPHDEHGEQVKAIVTIRATGGHLDASEIERELVEHCRGRLAAYKCPRSVDIVDEVPRLPTGKLATRLVRDPYWAGHETGIV